ncbi:hypothetical protein Barb7_00493 [Bacteroidales bacterium Barb7]|nr:hypothetical protein Barb7_00493 [Bacteroidales bacterium Barb7]
MRLPKKLNFGSVRKFLDNEVVKVRSFSLSFASNASYRIRVRNTAVRKEANKPIIIVHAKPLIGPVPKKNNTKPVIMDVRLESKIAEKAFL